MSIVVNLTTVLSGVRAMVRLGLMAEVGKLAIAQLLKMHVTQVPVLLSDEVATLLGVVVASQGGTAACLCGRHSSKIFICFNNSMLAETFPEMACLWKGT